MKKIALLGSTGSIGKNSLKIVEAFPNRFQVVGLTAATNIDLIEQQINQFHPKVVAVADPEKALQLKKRISPKKVEVLSGEEGIQAVATLAEADVVLCGIVGAAGLLPTLAAIKGGKQVALANKEVLVMAGALVKRELHSSKGKLIPVDSEHSALLQALGNRPISEVRRLVLTASGGPFLYTSREELEEVTPQQAIQHPRWNMGKKISVDSATMMNKGLEVIEARWLFDLPPKQIGIVIHPESIVHSLVEFVDGSILAQLGVTDMKIPIQYALTYPEHQKGCASFLNLEEIGRLTFFAPDRQKFPVLDLAYQVAEAGGTAPCVLNAANEVAVEAFLKGKIKFLDIVRLIRAALEKHEAKESYTLEEILELDKQVRQEVLSMCHSETEERRILIIKENL